MRQAGIAIRCLFMVVAVAAAAGLAGCDDAGSGPTWNGTFTRAITTCGTSLTSLPLDPPRDATIESEGIFEAGQRVTLFLDDSSCGFSGTIEAGGRLAADVHPGCPLVGRTIRILIENVFAAATVVHQTTDFTDPQRCDVEVFGTFDRE